MSNLKLVITLKKTLMTQIQNNQKFIGKSKPACIFKISKKSANQKSQGFCQIFTVSNKKCLG
jgi:hypothetical protein